MRCASLEELPLGVIEIVSALRVGNAQARCNR